MILHCSKCGDNHHTQDKLHGQGNRVHNKTSKETPATYRCTVCGNEQGAN